MLEILARAAWPSNTYAGAEPRTCIAAFDRGILDVFYRRPDWPLAWSALACLPAAGWLSVNWLGASAVDEPAPTAMSAIAIPPLLRSTWLRLLIGFMAAPVAVPIGAVRLYLLSQTDLMTQSLGPTTLLNWVAGPAMTGITIWLW